MKEKKITLDGNLQIVVYPLDPNLNEIKQPKTGIEDAKKSELEKYADIYYNEDLIRIGSTLYPFVFLAQTELNNVSMSIKQKPFKIPRKFEKFSEGILKKKLKPYDINGHVVRIAELKVNEEKVSLIGQKTGYFEFISTNLSQDVNLADYDASFRLGETLRDYEVKNGKSLDLRKSNMANILGVGFVVLAGDYFIFTRRNANLAVEPATLGLPGGTPKWKPEFHSNTKINFEGYLKEHTQEEMEEELCLKQNEYNITKGFFLKDFTRAPDIMLIVNVNIAPEDIAKRCYGKKSVLEEHDALYIVPKKRGALESLIHSNLMLNLPSRVAVDLVLKN